MCKGKQFLKHKISDFQSAGIRKVVTAALKECWGIQCMYRKWRIIGFLKCFSFWFTFTGSTYQIKNVMTDMLKFFSNDAFNINLKFLQLKIAVKLKKISTAPVWPNMAVYGNSSMIMEFSTHYLWLHFRPWIIIPNTIHALSMFHPWKLLFFNVQRQKKLG